MRLILTGIGMLVTVVSVTSQSNAEDLWGEKKEDAAAEKSEAKSEATKEVKEVTKTEKMNVDSSSKKKKKKAKEAASGESASKTIKVIYVEKPKAPEHVAEKPATPAAAPVEEVKAPVASSSIQVSGFIDAQFQSTSRHTFNGTSNQNSRGFSIHDGALYVSKTIGSGEAKLDVPFSLRDKGGSSVGSGTDSTGATVSVTNGNSVNFDIATVRAQAYISQKYENGLRWKIGQFDTSYGFEVNDTADVTFTRQGYVYNYTDPFVHTGLQAGYDFTSTFGVNLLAANRKDSGLQRDDRLQYGLQLVSTASFRWSLGALYQKALNGLDDIYADVTVGKTFGDFAVDAEMSLNNNEVTAKATPNTYGYLLNLVYSFSPRWSLGTRAEYLKNATIAGVFNEKTYLVFAGPQLVLNEALRLKIDYMFDQKKANSGSANEKTHGVQLAVVHRF
jgi:hypothetical protein